MPSGRTHDRITLWSLPWIVGFSLLFTRNSQLTLLIATAFLFSGLMFGPDLDIYSIQYQRWGILRTLWLPYRYLFKHRSWLTHGFLVGTSLRIAYLGFFLLLLGGLILILGQKLALIPENSLYISLEALENLLRTYPNQILAFLVGLELGSLSHALSDSLGTRLKKRRRKKSR